jgi:hypothetical protein
MQSVSGFKLHPHTAALPRHYNSTTGRQQVGEKKEKKKLRSPIPILVTYQGVRSEVLAHSTPKSTSFLLISSSSLSLPLSLFHSFSLSLCQSTTSLPHDVITSQSPMGACA